MKAGAIVIAQVSYNSDLGEDHREEVEKWSDSVHTLKLQLID